MNDVITIGDGMVTLNPSSNGPLRFVQSFERKIGGAELNFAIGCARLGLRTGWISRLGDDEFGKYIRNFVRGEGIDISQLKLVKGYQTSVNFKEIMEDGSGRTFYYRANSPTSTMKPDDLDEQYFQQARLLHISGVFPAIGTNNRKIIAKALRLARKFGLLVSFDPNIRLRLWDKETAKAQLTEYLPFVDVLLAGEAEAELLFGSSNPDIIFRKCDQYSIKYVAIKRGAECTIGYDGTTSMHVPTVVPAKVVDTVGAGDGFDCGFVYGLLNEWPLEKTLLFANTIGSMVVGVSGDNEGLPYLEEALVRMGQGEFIER